MKPAYWSCARLVTFFVGLTKMNHCEPFGLDNRHRRISTPTRPKRDPITFPDQTVRATKAETLGRSSIGQGIPPRCNAEASAKRASSASRKDGQT